MRATYEIEPPEAAWTLAVLESTGVPNGPERVRVRVLDARDGRATVEFPPSNWDGDVTLLVSSVLAGEWADNGGYAHCRLAEVDWPGDAFAGPAHGAVPGVRVGAIVKPSLGLAPDEVASTAAALARGGAALVKDDELLGNQEWCPLDERVRAVCAALPAHVVYAANVTGPVDGLLRRAERAVELGATALMLNAFAQGLDALRLLRARELGVPLFAHRVGAALLARGRTVGVAARVLAELTRLCGADYVQVGSYNGKLADPAADVDAQIAACVSDLGGVRPSTAVLGGGVGPHNAAGELRRAGLRDGVLVLLGSAAYAHPGGPEEGVRATVEAVAT